MATDEDIEGVMKSLGRFKISEEEVDRMLDNELFDKNVGLNILKAKRRRKTWNSPWEKKEKE